jgi:hypothetical protein
VARLPSRGIFLSYRREDAAPYARLPQYLFSERIPDGRVFMDLDSIEHGLYFAEVIREAIDSCTVLVALIGRQWATLTDEEGQRRLDNPDDYVRFEVQAALERGVRVIPVLVDGARPLRQQQLPAELQKLARLNALELSYGRHAYVQAKRYTDRHVGRPDIQAFVGALHGAQATRGVFITTSRFSADARDYAERVNARLVLIDGPELAALMIEHYCGVVVEESFVLKQVDENFFEEA